MAGNDQEFDNKNKVDEHFSSAQRTEGDSLMTDPHDALLKQQLSDYHPNDILRGWEKLEHALDEADEQFDREIRDQVGQFYPLKDPHAWSTFAKKYSLYRHLRTRLILIKLSEAAAILLLILTTFQLSELNPAKVETDSHEILAQLNPAIHPTPTVSNSGQATKNATVDNEQPIFIHSTSLNDAGNIRHQISFNKLPTNKNFTPIPYPLKDLPGIEVAVPSVFSAALLTASNQMSSNDDPTIDQRNDQITDQYSIDFLTVGLKPIAGAQTTDLALATIAPGSIKSSRARFLELGVLVQADYNQLKLPGDKVNTNEKQFTFPLQGLTSPGWGAGLTLGLAKGKWAFETGAVYNSKNFSPDREVVVEDEEASSNVELNKMLMQLISIPLQARYKFDHHGRLRTYAQGGFGLHMIMESAADVDVEFDIPGFTEIEDPSADPSLQRTIRQTQRAREDLRDQAPFQTNSLISANLGLGLEYDLFDHNALFIQSIYQYQIPNLRFQNQSDKHLLSLSFQAGIRMPL